MRTLLVLHDQDDCKQAIRTIIQWRGDLLYDTVCNVVKTMSSTTHDWEWFIYIYIPPIRMVMTWEWFMALFYPHYLRKRVFFSWFWKSVTGRHPHGPYRDLKGGERWSRVTVDVGSKVGVRWEAKKLHCTNSLLIYSLEVHWNIYIYMGYRLGVYFFTTFYDSMKQYIS